MKLPIYRLYYIQFCKAQVNDLEFKVQVYSKLFKKFDKLISKKRSVKRKKYIH